MNSSVYLRPLVVEDALISYQWRNNPIVWRHTGRKPTCYITPEMETEWIIDVLKREDEKRFAICLCENDKYIGNIFFTDIKNSEAQLHIFIGEVPYWGGGRACQSALLLLKHGFEVMGLKEVYILIKEKNEASLAAGKVVGFRHVSTYYDTTYDAMLVRSVFTREMYADLMLAEQSAHEQLS